jgi:hypothetical protein
LKEFLHGLQIDAIAIDEETLGEAKGEVDHRDDRVNVTSFSHTHLHPCSLPYLPLPHHGAY